MQTVSAQTFGFYLCIDVPTYPHVGVGLDPCFGPSIRQCTFPHVNVGFCQVYPRFRRSGGVIGHICRGSAIPRLALAWYCGQPAGWSGRIESRFRRQGPARVVPGDTPAMVVAWERYPRYSGSADDDLAEGTACDCQRSSMTRHRPSPPTRNVVWARRRSALPLLGPLGPMRW